MMTHRHILMPAVALRAATMLLIFVGPSGAPAQNPAPSLTRLDSPARALVTLKHPDSPTRAPAPNGFIQRWVILDPIRASGVTDSAVQATVKNEYFPNQFSIIPRDGDKVTVGNAELTWHAVDTINYNVNLYHFAHALNKPTSDVLFWAVTIVNCPEEMRGVRLAIGSNDASVWWVNGQEVASLYGDRQTVIDDAISKKLTLNIGPNVIRCAIHNQAGATDFCARFLDSQDKPITKFTLSAGNLGQ